MSVSGTIFGLLMVIGAFVSTKPLADLIVPQSEIDKIDAIRQWAEKELDRREAERGEQNGTD